MWIAALWILMAALMFGLLLVMSGANVRRTGPPPTPMPRPSQPATSPAPSP